MGLFGHGGHLSKLAHSIEHYAKGQDYYIGYRSNGDGTNGEIYAQAGPIQYGTNSGLQARPTIESTGYNYGNVGRNTTTAYKANTAGTANKIAQGGMTKDDILKYNIKHPNEIAGDNPANTTALNTNTAIRSN